MGVQSGTFVERDEHEREIVRLVTDAGKETHDDPRLLFFKGDGGTGKSELLGYARDVVTRRVGGKAPVAVVGASFEIEAGDDLTGIWASALSRMKLELIEETERLGLETPDFPLFDAFYGRGISTSSAAERWERNRPLWAKIAFGIGILVAILSVLDPLLPLQDVSVGLAGLVENLAPGWGTTIATAFVVAFVGVGLAGLFGKQLTGSVAAAGERFGNADLYAEFGKSPVDYHDRSDDDAAPSLPEVDHEVLIRALNADLGRWLTDTPDGTTVLVTLDLQQLTADDRTGSDKSVRELVRESVETMLSQATPASGTAPIPSLRAQQRFLVATKYENFWGKTRAPSGLFHRAHAQAHTIGVLNRMQAWNLVGNLLDRACATGDGEPTPLACELKRVFDETSTGKAQRWAHGGYRAPADGTGGDFHLHLMLVATAFGVLSAVALRSGNSTTEFDQLLASSVIEREDLLHRSLGNQDPADWSVDTGFDRRFERLLRDALSPITEGRDEAQPLVRALGHAREVDAVAACLFGVCGFGLSRDLYDLSNLRQQSFDQLAGTDRYRLGKDGRRLLLDDATRNLALESAPGFPKAIEAMEEFEQELARKPTEFDLDDDDGIEFALAWTHTVAFLLQHGSTSAFDEAKMIERFELLSEALFSEQDAEPIAADRELLRHKLAELAFLGLATRKHDPRDPLSTQLHGTLDLTRERYTAQRSVLAMPALTRQAYLRLIRHEAGDRDRAGRLAAELQADAAGDEAGHWLDIADATSKADYSPEMLERLLARDPGSLDGALRTRLFKLVRKVGNSLASREPDIPRSQVLLDAMLERLDDYADRFPEHRKDIAFQILRTAIFRRERLLRDNASEGPEWDAAQVRMAGALAILRDPDSDFSEELQLPEWVDCGDLLFASEQAKGEHADAIDAWLRARRITYFDDAISAFENAREMNADRCYQFAPLASPLSLSLRVLFEGESRPWKVHPSETDALREAVRALRQAYLDFVLDKFERKTGSRVPDRSDPDFVAACRRFIEPDFPMVPDEFGKWTWDRSAREIASALLGVLAFANPHNAQVKRGRPVVVDRFKRAPGRPLSDAGKADRHARPENVVVVAASARCEAQPVIAQGYVPSRLWTRWKPAPGEEVFSELDGPPFIANLLADENSMLEPSTLAFPYWPATAKGQMHARRMLELFFPIYPEDVPAEEKPWMTMGGSNSILVAEVDAETRHVFAACGGALEQILRAIAILNRIILVEWDGTPLPNEPMDRLLEKARAFITATYAMKAADGSWLPGFLPTWNDEAGRLELWTATGDPAAPLRDTQKLRTFHGLFRKVFDKEPHYDFGFVEGMVEEAKRRAF